MGHCHLDIQLVIFIATVCPRSIDTFYIESTNLLYKMGQDFLDMSYNMMLQISRSDSVELKLKVKKCNFPKWGTRFQNLELSNTK